VWGEIDTAIRHYDKLVVICSQHTLQSPPVIREIARALQKEDRERRNVLFPIRIDDYLFDEWEHPRKADVVSKVIGDFRGSGNLAAYAKVFPVSSKPSTAPSKPRRPGSTLRRCCNQRRGTAIPIKYIGTGPGHDSTRARYTCHVS